MMKLGLATKLAPSTSWTCPSCLHKQKSGSQAASYATRSGRFRTGKTKRRTVVLATAGGSLGAGAMLTTASDDVKHGYAAAERTGRVASTLFACINE